MIKVTICVDKEETSLAETISAPSIREAVVMAQARYPEEEVRVSYPIDGEAFFPKPRPASRELRRGRPSTPGGIPGSAGGRGAVRQRSAHSIPLRRRCQAAGLIDDRQ